MKKFAKLALLFAAVGLAACTNDTTEDLVTSPDFAGGGSVKTLSIALDTDTKVALGEKTADEKYPVEWQEGDVLRINEGKTTAIAIREDRSVAEFTFAVADAEAYSIVYPYTEGLAAATEGCLPVQFATVQNYTESTFDTASFPLYGYVEGTELAGSLNYLAGVLMFEVKGSGEKLTKVELTVTDGALAGTFDVNCATGALTAHEDASKTLTYQLPEGGIALSETATTLYIAVPAGDYGTMKAKFCTDNAEVAMTAGVPCTGEKAIKAGVVREFKNIVFADNSEDFSGDVFEIYDEATLAQFAELVAAGTFAYGSASVTQSFDLSSEFAAAWTPIEGYALTLEGNGNTISGVVKPLFGTTTATIKNLNLKANVTITDMVWGAFANVLTTTNDKRGRIENCSLVSGSSIKVAYEGDAGLVKDAEGNAVYTEESVVVAVGGIVSKLLGADIVSSQNNASVEIANVGTGTILYYNAVGGIAGYAHSNIAEVADAENQTLAVASISKCSNGGDFAVKAQNPAQTAFAGGMVGMSLDCSIDDSHNTAVMESVASDTDHLYMGGIVGLLSSLATTAQEITGCTNSGTVTVDAESVTNRMMIGGVVGLANDVLFTVRKCTNTGNITARGILRADTGTYCQIGGVIGRSAAAHLYDCVNGVEGDPTQGTVSHYTVAHTFYDNVSLAVAGVAAYQHGTCTASGCVNHASITSQVTNLKTSTNTVLCGGCFGYNGSTNAAALIENCTNNGPVTAYYGEGSEPAIFRLGGVSSYAKPESRNVKNTGAVTFHQTGNTLSLLVGGVVGLKSNNKLTHAVNTGAVTANLKEGIAMTDIWVGGIAASRSGSANAGCTNSGDVTLNGAEGATQRRVAVGGTFGYVTYPLGQPDTEGISPTNHNSGNVTVLNVAAVVGEEEDYNGYVMVGGIAGCQPTGYASMNRVISNEGDVKVTGSGVRCYAAGLSGLNNTGLAGDATRALDLTDAEYYTNKGNIEVDVTTTDKMYIGGIYGSGYGRVEGAVNRGEITLKGAAGAAIYTGGVIGYKARVSATTATGCDIISCVNHGVITNEGAHKSTLYVGGVIGAPEGGHTDAKPGVIVNDIINTAPLTMGGSASSHLYLGGNIGYDNSDSGDRITNKATITVTGSFKSIRLGGNIGHARCATISGLNNEAAVTVTSAAKTAASENCYVGGCIGFSDLDSGEVGGLFSNSENSGAVTVALNTNTKLRIGGVIGNSYMIPSGLTNKGTVTVEGGEYHHILMGGVLGYMNTQTGAENCTNEAKVHIKNTVTLTTGLGMPNYDFDTTASTIGGVVGCSIKTVAGNAASFKSFTNSGEVLVEPLKSTNIVVGGVVGYGVLDFSSFENTADVTLRCADMGAVYLGGVQGLMAEADADSCKDSENSGTLTCDVTSNNTLSIGGVIGVSAGYGGRLTNNGDINVSGSTTGTLRVGGAVGANGYSSQAANYNNGDITISAKANIAIIGGVQGYYTVGYTKNGVKNTGAITITPEAETVGSFFVGGVIGLSNSKADNSMTANLTNTANIVFNGTAGTDCYLGGVIGCTIANNAGKLYTIGETMSFGADGEKAPVLRYAGTTNNVLYYGLLVAATDGDTSALNPVYYGAGMVTGSYTEIVGGASEAYGESGNIEFLPDYLRPVETPSEDTTTGTESAS